MRIYFLLAIVFVSKLITGQNGFIYVGQAYNGKVAKINPITNTVVATYKIADSIGTADHSITDLAADTAKNWLYTACSADNSIGMIDLNSGTATYPLPTINGLGKVPIGLALNKAGTKLFVTTRGVNGVVSSTNPLEIFDIVGTSFPPALIKDTAIAVGKHPINVVLSHNEQYAVVSCRNEPSLVVIDLNTNQIVFNHVFTNTLTEPEGLILHPTQNIVYCTNHGANSITILDLNAMAIVNTYTIPAGPPPPPQPSSGMFTPNGNKFVLLGQTSNKLYYFNTSNPANPTPIGTPVNCGGAQPHKGVFINDSVAYIPNTNNTQINGTVAYFNINSATNATTLAPTFHGPLGMVYLKNLTTGLNSESELGLIEFYPNPANDKINVISRFDKEIRFEIMDLNGRILKTGMIASEGQIEVKEIENGFYLLQLETYAGVIQKKLVVNR